MAFAANLEKRVARAMPSAPTVMPATSSALPATRTATTTTTTSARRIITVFLEPHRTFVNLMLSVADVIPTPIAKVGGAKCIPTYAQKNKTKVNVAERQATAKLASAREAYAAIQVKSAAQTIRGASPAIAASQRKKPATRIATGTMVPAVPTDIIASAA